MKPILDERFNAEDVEEALNALDIAIDEVDWAAHKFRVADWSGISEDLESIRKSLENIEEFVKEYKDEQDAIPR